MEVLVVGSLVKHSEVAFMIMRENHRWSLHEHCRRLLANSVQDLLLAAATRTELGTFIIVNVPYRVVFSVGDNVGVVRKVFELLLGTVGLDGLVKVVLSQVFYPPDFVQEFS